MIPVLKEIVPANITIIDSGEAVARQTKTVLEGHGLLSERQQSSKHQFYTNKEVAVLKSLVGGPNVEVAYLDF